MPNPFQQITDDLKSTKFVSHYGRVSGVSGMIVSCTGLENTAIGACLEIEDVYGDKHPAEVIGYKDGQILLMPYGNVEGIGPKCRVYMVRQRAVLRISDAFKGRVINALGEPIDGKGPIPNIGVERALKAKPPAPASRKAVGGKLNMGVRCLNTFVPVCEGQRLGIFAGSGVGKSVLLSMIAKYTSATVNVIGLVGERGREVKEFIDQNLGEEGLKNSVVIVATGDEPPLMRRQAAYLTLAVAEHFRDEEEKVMLFMDSVTRFALAQREIGLSAGEPPTTRGFTPSVFSELPRLLERAGPALEGSNGSITAIFTVLVEGGDMDEPVADAVRGILDGHILMDRLLAERGHFPAIDVLKSVSRMLPDCHSDNELSMMTQARKYLATYTDMEELIRLGAYKKGSDAEIDAAIFYYEKLENYLKQRPGEHASIEEGFMALRRILNEKINTLPVAG